MPGQPLVNILIDPSQPLTGNKLSLKQLIIIWIYSVILPRFMSALVRSCIATVNYFLAAFTLCYTFTLNISLQLHYTIPKLKRLRLSHLPLLQVFSIPGILCSRYSLPQVFPGPGIPCSRYSLLQVFSVPGIPWSRYPLVQVSLVFSVPGIPWSRYPLVQVSPAPGIPWWSRYLLLQVFPAPGIPCSRYSLLQVFPAPGIPCSRYPLLQVFPAPGIPCSRYSLLQVFPAPGIPCSGYSLLTGFSTLLFLLLIALVAQLGQLRHATVCLYLFSDSEAYHEQTGPIPSSNGSLDIALSIVHT